MKPASSPLGSKLTDRRSLSTLGAFHSRLGASIAGLVARSGGLGIEPTPAQPQPVREGARRAFSFSSTVPGKPEHVFPLLCPTLEYDWIEGWNAWLIHSDSGVAEPGAVFRTRIGTGETWIMTHSERNRRAQYTVFTGAAVMVLDILLSDNGDGTTTVEWTRTYTATSRVGRRVIRRFADDAIRGEIAAVHHSLDHFLRTGQKLPRADALRLAADSARTLEQGVCS